VSFSIDGPSTSPSTPPQSRARSASEDRIVVGLVIPVLGIASAGLFVHVDKKTCEWSLVAADRCADPESDLVPPARSPETPGLHEDVAVLDLPRLPNDEILAAMRRSRRPRRPVPASSRRPRASLAGLVAPTRWSMPPDDFAVRGFTHEV
jgi:hypothetical protein